MRQLVRRRAEKRSGRAFARYERDHRVLHPAVAALRDRELRVGVGPVARAEDADQIGCLLAERRPLLGHFRLVEQVEGDRVGAAGHVVYAEDGVDVVGVGGPGEIVDALGAEVPRERVRG